MDKHPGLAIILGKLGKSDKPKRKEPDGDEFGLDMGAEDVAADEMCDCLDVPEDKREAFKEALAAYVDASVTRAVSASDDDDGDEG